MPYDDFDKTKKELDNQYNKAELLAEKLRKETGINAWKPECFELEEYNRAIGIKLDTRFMFPHKLIYPGELYDGSYKNKKKEDISTVLREGLVEFNKKCGLPVISRDQLNELSQQSNEIQNANTLYYHHYNLSGWHVEKQESYIAIRAETPEKLEEVVNTIIAHKNEFKAVMEPILDAIPQDRKDELTKPKKQVMGPGDITPMKNSPLIGIS